jgi:hypothetical protein
MRRSPVLLALVTVVLGGVAAGALAAHQAAGPRIAGCAVFPADNAWNRDISRAKVNPRSDAYIRSIGAGLRLHPDFGSGKYGFYGFPVTIAPASLAGHTVKFTDYPDESDKGPYPIPASARIEGGSDHHVIVVQRSGCKLYELFGARRSGGRWLASNGAIFDLKSNRRRPAGWTSADAAGLPILPGLARADEANAGAIRHALRFTVPRTQRAYIPPARHQAGSDTDPNLPPMGLRLRLKASYSLSGYHGQSRVILLALRHYGMLVADNGSPWYISGTADKHWNDADLEQLKRVPASAFEVIS